MQLKRSVSFSKTNMMGSNLILQQTKQKKTKNKNKDAPRITHSIWSNKNIAHRKMTCCFVDEEGDALGIPKLWCFYLLDIYLGGRGIPSLSFCPFFISLHHSSLPTLENFLHTKLHTILISSISAIKITNPFGFSSNIYQTSIKTLDTVATPSKRSFSQKNSRRKKIRGKCK
jgi:hypothetical protein